MGVIPLALLLLRGSSPASHRPAVANGGAGTPGADAAPPPALALPAAALLLLLALLLREAIIDAVWAIPTCPRLARNVARSEARVARAAADAAAAAVTAAAPEAPLLPRAPLPPPQSSPATDPNTVEWRARCSTGSAESAAAHRVACATSRHAIVSSGADVPGAAPPDRRMKEPNGGVGGSPCPRHPAPAAATAPTATARSSLSASSPESTGAFAFSCIERHARRRVAGSSASHMGCSCGGDSPSADALVETTRDTTSPRSSSAACSRANTCSASASAKHDSHTPWRPRVKGAAAEMSQHKATVHDAEKQGRHTRS